VRRQAKPGNTVLFPQAGGNSKMFFKVTMGGQRTSEGGGERERERERNQQMNLVLFILFLKTSLQTNSQR